ncbi:MAG: putative B6 ABC transporter ATP-binding protein [Alphaproteobacteria bacterium]
MATTGQDEMNAPAVAVEGITKRFPGVIANDDVSLTFNPGEIHVLLGENGAGKSTLIGILAGMQQPDAGVIRIAGKAVRLTSPRESLDRGIGTVFQHVLLVQSLTVIENLMLGGSWRRRLDRATAMARFRELSQLLAVSLDPDAEVGRLSLGEQQQVEIIRALWHGGQVLILDEPTSMLTPAGVHELGQVMGRLRDQGVAIVFITHKLKEAYEFGDRISVLRLGRMVGEITRERLATMSEQAATDEVIRLMFGPAASASEGDADTMAHEGEHRQRATAVDFTAPPSLIVRDLCTTALPGETALHDVTFDVRPGEILGIAGVDGNGQKQLAEALAGQRPTAAGFVSLHDTEITHLNVAARRQLGLRYITDDRVGEGTVGIHSLATNLVLKEVGKAPFWWHGLTRWDQIHSDARTKIESHDIRTPSEKTPISRLSGGNIQKALLARELSTDDGVVIFNKPTYGLDLHNIRTARARISQGADAGLATILISNELDELVELCDRIGVMYQGRLNGIVDNVEGADIQIGLLMTGASAEPPEAETAA